MTPKLLNILLLVASFALYYGVVSPLYTGSDSVFFDSTQNIKNLTERLAVYTKTAEATPALIKHANSSAALFTEISEADRKNIMTMVPVSIDKIKLMSELTNIGVISGTMIEGMGVKDKEDGTYAVSFNFLTTYTNFKKIMTYWENSKRLFTVQSISFSPGKTEEEMIKFNVELMTYYMK